jgi:hypothetical protein
VVSRRRQVNCWPAVSGWKTLALISDLDFASADLPSTTLNKESPFYDANVHME